MEVCNLKSIDGILLEAAIHRARTRTSVGTIVQAHGIAADMSEGGMFVRLAERLADAAFDVVRFSFRGHGNSGGAQREMTIAGEMQDLQAVLDYTEKTLPRKPLSIIAASFGAVSTLLYLPNIEKRLRGLVLWNPVLDLHKTFIQPMLPWGKKNFNLQSVKHLASQGYLLLDGTFEVGRALHEEMRHLRPLDYFVKSTIPSIIIHGDMDTYVPYEVSKEACRQRRNCKLFTIKGSDHGFDGKENEDKAIEITANWLIELY